MPTLFVFKVTLLEIESFMRNSGYYLPGFQTFNRSKVIGRALGFRRNLHDLAHRDWGGGAFGWENNGVLFLKAKRRYQ